MDYDYYDDLMGGRVQSRWDKFREGKEGYTATELAAMYRKKYGTKKTATKKSAKKKKGTTKRCKAAEKSVESAIARKKKAQKKVDKFCGSGVFGGCMNCMNGGCGACMGGAAKRYTFSKAALSRALNGIITAGNRRCDPDNATYNPERCNIKRGQFQALYPELTRRTVPSNLKLNSWAEGQRLNRIMRRAENVDDFL